jgi:ClpP class serine protease
MSLLGFPIMKYIDINDAEQVIRAIHLTDPDVPIDIILHTPGGLLLPSLQIARAIERHKAKVTAFVPHYAMSGGTLLALAADEIVMDDHAVIGPLDPQLGNFPAASILRVIKKKPIEHVDDETLILADLAEKALSQIKSEIIDLLSERYPPEKTEFIADALSQGHWTHDHPISVKEAMQIGLPIKKVIPTEIYQLMELFPQPVKYQPTVEYLPTPRQPQKRPGAKNF